METDPEEHRLNYERYRTLVMIDCSGGQSISYLFPLNKSNLMDYIYKYNGVVEYNGV